MTESFNVLKNKLVQWIKDWFNENGPDCNAVVAMSGGKDSTIVAALCVEALGKDRVIGVGIPDTGQSLNDADKIAEYLGIKFLVFPISGLTDEIKSVFPGHMSKQTEQNIPPRLRMTVLYAVSQSNNGRVIGTTNLDERLTGYFTKYGDGLACDVEPVEMLTVGELLKIGECLGVPGKWLYKTPSADLPNTGSDEDELGFSYGDLDKYIRKTGELPRDVVTKIETRIGKNAYKLKPIAHFEPDKTK